MAEPLHEHRLVRPHEPVPTRLLVGLAQEREPEGLRCLHRPELGPIEGGLDHLAGLTIPVRLTGPFDAPKYEIDYAAIASQAAKAKAQEKVQKKLQDLLRRR